MKTFNRRHCYLHIGTHKTGSTSIQKALTIASIKESPADAGFLYPFSGNISSIIRSHHNIAYELMNDPDFKLKYGTLSDLKFEISNYKTGNIVLSSEIFELLHANAPALYNLKKILNNLGLEVTVVVFFRDKPEYANSLYKELVNHGLDVSPEDFAAMILDSNRFVYKNRCYSFNYSNITDGFAQVFGTKNVIVLKYENNVIEEFSNITSIKLDTSIKLNSSSSNTVTAIIRMLNKIGLPEPIRYKTMKQIDKFLSNKIKKVPPVIPASYIKELEEKSVNLY